MLLVPNPSKTFLISNQGRKAEGPFDEGGRRDRRMNCKTKVGIEKTRRGGRSVSRCRSL